jgi:glycine cleavage system H protein
MSKVPADLKYTKTHEWLRTLPDGSIEIGITDHAQHALGDLVFVEVPETGRAVKAGEPCAVVESVGNPKLASEPETVNTDPYGGGWLMRVRPSGAGPAAELMTPGDYEKLQQEEGD